MIMVLLDNDLLLCELDPEMPLLKHRWIRKPTSEEFQIGLVEIQKIFLQHKGKYPNLKWLADTELLGELTEEDEKWLSDVWEDLLFVQAGVKVHAVILGDDIFADYSMEHFKAISDRSLAEKGISLGVFLHSEKAYKWLEEH